MITLLLLLCLQFQLWSQCGIEGEALLCTSGLEIYGVDHDPLQNPSYTWTLSGGGSIIAGQGSSLIDVVWTTPGEWLLNCDIYNENMVIIESCELDVVFSTITQGLGFHVIGLLGKTNMACIGSELTVSFNSDIPEILDDLDVQWAVNGVDATYQSPQHGTLNITPNEAGILEVCVTVTDMHGCSTQYCSTIEVIDINEHLTFESIPSAAIGEPLEVCIGQTVIFDNTSDLPILLEWVVTFTDQNQDWTYYSEDLEFKFEQSGEYVVTLMPQTGQVQCPFEPVMMQIKVDDLPPIIIKCPKAVCNDDIVTYEAVADCQSFTWTIDNEVGEIISSSGNMVQVQWHNIAGKSQGILTVIGEDCVGHCPFPSTIFVPLFPPSATIEGDNPICGPSSGIAIRTYSLPKWPGVTYDWTLEILNSLSGDAQLSGNGRNIQSVRLIDGFHGTFELSVVAEQDIGECAYTGSIVVDVFNNSIGGDANVCFGEDATFHLNPPMSIEVDWTLFDDGGNEVYAENGVIGDWTIPHTVLFPGTFIASAMIPSGNPGGCLLERSFRVREPIAPPIISGPQEICLNTPITTLQMGHLYVGKHLSVEHMRVV